MIVEVFHEKGNRDMKINTNAFPEGGVIPDKYARQGSNMNPPLHLDDIPSRARSLALIVDDPDAPSGTFNHWVIYNIDPKTHDIKENSVPVIATQGRNDFGDVEYDGPQPPSGEHRYFFKAFALDTVLDLPRGARRQELEKAMEGHVLDQAATMGRYAKH
jgi:Raf kinase inhibitor-like YbhB/YbcL family protein